MPEINVLALFRAKPEHRDELKRQLSRLAEAVHTESGCLLYSLQQGTDDPDVFAYVEKWESEDALAAHGKAPHMLTGAADRSVLMAEPGTVVFTRSVGAGTHEQGTL
ncbi:MAG: putative quinol monooxygenase [Nakamurella sp.]